MSSRRIFLPSPREPSGATWLINCFLELGIRTFRQNNTNQEMWLEEGNRFVLNPAENILRKWLPALSDHNSFDFRDDVEVEWLHQWPTAQHRNSKAIFFVRDLRDSLYSRYRRENATTSYSSYALFPDHNTLLDKIDNWTLFCESWLSLPDVHVFRFEDYKRNACETLAAIVDAMELRYSDGKIEKAAKNSTFDRAREAEAQYRRENPEDRQLINRSGAVGEWQTHEDTSVVSRQIEQRAFRTLRCFGYVVDGAQVQLHTDNYGPNVGALSFFADRLLPDEIRHHASDTEAARQRSIALLEFAENLEANSLNCSGLLHFEKVQLVDSLREILEATGKAEPTGLIELRKTLRLEARSKASQLIRRVRSQLSKLART